MNQPPTPPSKDAVLANIAAQVRDNPVVIYMKGSPQMPQCGFSARAVAAIGATDVPFAFVDILKAPEIREHLPSFSDWPTFPQIFANGEFIGGGDIVVELAENEELKPILAEAHTAHSDKT